MIRESRRIFIASSLFLAFIDRGNQNHTKAVEVFEFLGERKFQVFTSNIVVLQTFNAIEHDLGSALGNDFLQAIIDSKIETLYPNEADLIVAFKYLKTNPTHKRVLSSIINANLMQKNGIISILTFDYWPNLMGTTVSNLITG